MFRMIGSEFTNGNEMESSFVNFIHDFLESVGLVQQNRVLPELEIEFDICSFVTDSS